jgi:hypothetical protein
MLCHAVTALDGDVDGVCGGVLCAGQEYWRYRRAFSPGLQEFIEAVSFLHFIKHGNLITREEVEEVIRAGTPNVQCRLSPSDSVSRQARPCSHSLTSPQPRFPMLTHQHVTFFVNDEDYLLGIAGA